MSVSASATATAPDQLPGQLHALFGHDAFRPGQEAVVRAVMDGQCVLALMPTGAGKSLCYQLPALLLPGTTLVISPLIALMKDQVDGLPEAAYQVTTLVNSSLSPEAIEQRLADIAAGKYKLVYAAPERLRQWPFLHALRRAGLSLLVIDEAHCVDLWGHDFRPDYLFVGEAAKRLGSPAVLAMTATATAELADRLSDRFGRPFTLLSTGVLRPNLRLEAIQCPDDEAKLRAVVQLLRQERGSAIVYVNSRERTEAIARLLQRQGVSAAAYHAGLDSATRAEAQEAFMLDRTRAVVATVAFGMGIDKANVRLIVHFGVPKSLEAYAQESGRAGRDGRPARCVLLFSAAEKSKLRRWLNEERLNLDSIRAVYRALRDAFGKPPTTGRIGFSQLAADTEAADPALSDETAFRVALSVLDNAGLLRRRLDLPTRVGLEIMPEFAATAEGAALVEQLELPTGRRQWVDPFQIAAALAVDVAEVEGCLLDWQAEAKLRYRPTDRQFLIELLPPPPDIRERMERLLAKAEHEDNARLEQMMRYANATICRQRFIAAHFGQRAAGCGRCDICAPDRETAAADDDRPEGGGDPATSIRDLLRGLPFRVGKLGLVKILTGSISSPIKADRCPQFGALADCRKGWIERWVDELLASEHLAWEQDGEYRVLGLTNRWDDETPTLVRPGGAARSAGGAARKPASPRASTPLADPTVGATGAQTLLPTVEPAEAPELDLDLFERLRAWRLGRARQDNVPPYVIFHDATLRLIATYQPTSIEALAKVPGVGPAKLSRFGDEVMNLIADEATATDITFG